MLPNPIWITGAAGLIGNCLVQIAPKHAPSAQLIPLTRAKLDLEDFPAVREAFRKDSPGMVIHCAALTNTPACEKNPPLTQKLNVDVTAVLAELAADIPFIFFSTDLVFDGRSGNYDESAPVSPLSVYGKSKAEAERIVLANPRHTVLRTSLNYGTSLTGTRAFNEQMKQAVDRGETLGLFTDEFRCPIPAIETARAVWELAAQDKPGLYHRTGAERLSRLQIGQLLINHWGKTDAKIRLESVKDFRGLPRSPDTSFNCAKIQKLLSAPLPRFSEWLAKEASAPV